MKRALVLAAALAAASFVPAGAAAALSLRASVEPASVGLGDRFTYTVEASGASSGIRVFADTGPFVTVSGPRTTRSGDTVRVTQTLQCVDRGCVPNTKPRRVPLPPPRATVGGTVVRGAPAAVTLVPRVPETVVRAARAGYLRQTAVGAPSSRLPLGATAAAAVVLAVLAGLGAVALLALEVRRVTARRRREATRAGGLELALRLLRESAGRPVPDRRRAADLVAREAGAAEATRVAWARPEPGPDDVRELAGEVESASGSRP
jgi:hypothetical protein